MMVVTSNRVLPTRAGTEVQPSSFQTRAGGQWSALLAYVCENVDLSFVLFSFLKKLINLFVCFLFLAVLGLRCCAQAFSSCSERGLLFVVVRRLLIAVACLVVEHGL